MYRYFVLFFLLVISITFNTYAQKPTKDSVATKTDSIIHEVKVFAQKDNFISRVLSNFLVIERKSGPVKPKTLSNRTFKEYEGKYIRNITITVLDVFGSSINNINKKENSWLEKAGNKLHKNTKEWVIKQRLLFREGQALIPLRVSETERVLRQYKNTYDARIIAKKIPQVPDSIDLFVVVQDVWSITGSGSINPARPSGSLGLTDVNFLGFGNELNGRVFYNGADSVPWHYSLEYTNYNIVNSFVQGNIYYKNLPATLNYGVGINREFFTPTISLAGGSNFNWLESRLNIYDLDSNIVSKGFNNNTQDLWLGYGASFQESNQEKNYFVASRILKTRYTKYPIEDTFKLAFQNSTLILGSVGYTYRRFITDNYIFGLGRTEDIPIGKMVTLTAGYENGQYFKRPYFGAKAAISDYYEKLGYFSISAEFGSFRFNNHWQDEILSGELLYYSKLIPLGNWRWRNFFWNRITYGYNTAPGRILNINKREGIRGFRGGYVVGNKKYVINYESIFHTPFNVIGFRTAFIFFADFAFIGMNQDPLLKGRFYQAYGLGFRFRNEHLIFRTIQITLGYYPNVMGIPQDTFSFFEESRAFYQFTNFQFSRPRPVEF